MYRNIVYNKRNRTVSLMTWDENGERITVQASYEPYLYLETKKQTPFESLFDTFLKKRTFTSPSHRNRFLNELDTKRVFENIRWDQQYLIDTFIHQNEEPEFTQHPI